MFILLSWFFKREFIERKFYLFERKRDRESSHLLAQSQNALSSQKMEARVIQAESRRAWQVKKTPSWKAWAVRDVWKVDWVGVAGEYMRISRRWSWRDRATAMLRGTLELSCDRKLSQILNTLYCSVSSLVLWVIGRFTLGSALFEVFGEVCL